MECNKCDGIIFENVFYHEYGCPNFHIEQLVLCNSCGYGFDSWTPEGDLCPECWDKGITPTFSMN